jgi:4-hydroxybenzoyl-CoA thioesterase
MQDSEASSSTPFSVHIIVRFGDVDFAGFVYYPTIFHYLHIALEEFFKARCGVSYRALLADERLGFPTVNVKAEFFVPLVYGDEAIVELFISRIGRSSAVFDYSINRASGGVLCARFSNIQVAMNLDSRRAVPIPDKYRRAFAESSK